ncbi:MAG: hypothetical protein JWL73_2548 [Actinomycetia bacterium]|nr:hypothetical protein [Actinomycetes bacterium]
MQPVRRLKAYQKVLLVTVVAVVGGFIVFGVTFAGVDDARSRLLAVQEQAAPQVAVLQRLSAELTADRLEFQSAADATDAVSRTAQLQATGDTSAQATADWKIFKRHSLHLSGEDALVTHYDDTAATSKDVGRRVALAIIATPAGQLSARSADLADLLGKMESRMADVRQINEIYTTASDAGLAATMHSIDGAIRDGIIAFVTAMVVGLGIAFVSVRDTRRQELEQERKERERADDARRTAFDHRLGIGLDMVRAESDAFTVLQRALVEVVEDRPVELLIADSSMSHFRRSIAVDPEGTHGCDVATPEACPATRSGQTMVFESSTSLEACPHLAESATPLCSALCVPVATSGQPIGVIHMKGPDHEPAVPKMIDDVKIVARKAGERISALRVLADTSAQARTDPLTGLMNRRSVENRVRELVANDREYVVAYADLDHFKRLNDKHGHDAGDRALRLFAQVLADSVRPDDIPARYGGEEFLIVLPDCTVTDALQVLERVREMLAQRLGNATLPTFTASFGLAGCGENADFGEVVARADAALLTAKREGRDRIVVAEPKPSGEPDAQAPTGFGTAARPSRPGIGGIDPRPVTAIRTEAANDAAGTSDPVSPTGPRSPTRTG